MNLGLHFGRPTYMVVVLIVIQFLLLSKKHLHGAPSETQFSFEIFRLCLHDAHGLSHEIMRMNRPGVSKFYF